MVQSVCERERVKGRIGGGHDRAVRVIIRGEKHLMSHEDDDDDDDNGKERRS